MSKELIKVLTQMAIGLGAVLATIAITRNLPTWVVPVGAIIYLIGIIKN